MGRIFWLMALLLAPAFSTGASAADYAIVIKDMKFGPPPKILKIGDRITWTNNDIFRHTATARNGAFDLSLAARHKPDGHPAKTRRRPGVLRFHPDMMVRLAVGK